MEAVEKPEKLQQAIARSEELHEQLWSQALAVSQTGSAPVLTGLFIQAVNDVIDLHSKRVTEGLLHRIPAAIWAALYFVAMLAMTAVGYHFGLSCSRSLIAFLVVAVTFSAVILLIADLDRSTEGALKVSQQPLIGLQRHLSIPAK